MRRILAALALLLLAAGPAFAYTIFLKDGSTLTAREKYRVVGDKAQIVLPSGARTVLSMSDIDVPRTERANQSDFGSALVMEGPAGGPTPTPPPKGPTLSDVAAMRREPAIPLPQPAPPAEAPPLPQRAAAATAERTGTGDIDLMRLPRTPLARVAVGTQLGEMLRARGVERVGFYEGTAPGRVLVDIRANSEGAVFQALSAAAEALVAMEEKSPGTVSELELFMITERRQRAGQFLLTPDRARELTGKQLDVSAFFLKYVQF
jgi:hypothetical protein